MSSRTIHRIVVLDRGRFIVKSRKLRLLFSRKGETADRSRRRSRGFHCVVQDFQGGLGIMSQESGTDCLNSILLVYCWYMVGKQAAS